MTQYELESRWVTAEGISGGLDLFTIYHSLFTGFDLFTIYHSLFTEQ